MNATRAAAGWTVLLVAFAAFGPRWLDAFVMPDEAYDASLLLAHAVSGALPMALVLLPTLACLLPRPALSWASFGIDGRAARLVAGGMALALAYPLALHDFDGYHGKLHGLDRLLVAALGAVVLLSPALVPPFLAAAATILGQFHHPLGFYFSWTETRILYDLLILLSLHAVARRLWLPVPEYMDATRALVAATYFWAGASKLATGWPGANRLDNLVVNAWANGWLAFLPAKRFLTLAHAVGALNPLLIAATLLIELAAPLLLLRGRAAELVLLGFVLFHTAVFALSGALFWPWIALDVLLLWTLRQAPAGPPPRVSLWCGMLAVAWRRCGFTRWSSEPSTPASTWPGRSRGSGSPAGSTPSIARSWHPTIRCSPKHRSTPSTPARCWWAWSGPPTTRPWCRGSIAAPRPRCAS